MNTTASTRPAVTLRTFEPQDIPILAQWKEAIQTQQYMSRLTPSAFDGESTSSSLYRWYVIQHQGSDIGAIWLEKGCPDDNAAVLGILIGEPGLLGKGLGRAAVHAAIEASRGELGFDTVRLNVRASNRRAIRCYQSCGFEIVSSGQKQIGSERVDFHRMSLQTP